MTTTPATSSVAATTATTANSTSLAQQQIGQTLDSFLTMLTTQLQNQDPLSPMNTTEFTNQLVGFASVEQAIGQNQRLDRLIALQSTGGVGQALGYLGRTVEVSGQNFTYSGGTSTVSYSLPQQAEQVAISILNAQGGVVWRGTGATAAGVHTLEWDGSMESGSTATAGTYTLQIDAVDSAGERITASTTMAGRVTGIETRNGETVLMVGSTAVSPSDVTAVRAD